ncbi:MAG: hypothetical protein A3E79_16845 [Burkholderiales bacterium RIFCSPHIGHO2_12_FULL_61_11]|nr:MAG: hypothetical protein A3E79_16845 [Burkholderiales bacterium RIFCSPHIGHO2_12_FULL_61_11]
MTLHNAPPVVYPLGRSRFLGWLLLALWLAGLLALLLWSYATRQLDWRMAFAVAAVVGTGVLARVGWNNSPTGQLVWDGEVWRWESSSYRTGIGEYKLSLIADFQSMLLLRLENQAGARLWLWVEQGVLPERWLDLRRAVYSPHKSSTPSRQHDMLPAEPLPAAAPLPAIHPVEASE